jgi:hypothetical protein
MYLVSGTKRSGTSMWMQVLAAAGLPVLGDRFSRAWGKGPMRQANPNGFFESHFRDGIFFGTNPDPLTGRYVRPGDMPDTVVKVFVPGVVRTELSFIDGVIANIRDFRDHEASMRRLWALQDQQRREQAPDQPPIEHLAPHLEWWVENFTLVRDQGIRGYPIVMQSYEALLADPEPYVRRALELVGDGDVEAAVAAVEPEARTVVDARSDHVEPNVARVFDDLYGTVDRGHAIGPSLQRALQTTHRLLQPQIADWRMRTARARLLAGDHPSPAMMLSADLA